MGQRLVYRFTVSARPFEPEKDGYGQEKHWRGRLLVAGDLKSCLLDINAWLKERGLESTSYGPYSYMWPANDRESPGVLELTEEEWVWVEPRL